MAAKVALMKLKQTATGDGGIPMDSRVYISVQLPATDSSNLQPKYSPHWLDQVPYVGVAFSLISVLFLLKSHFYVYDLQACCIHDN